MTQNPRAAQVVLDPTGLVNVTSTDVQGAIEDLDAAAGGGGSLTVQDENSNVSTSVTQIDLQGAGVSATSGTGEVVVTIPGYTDEQARDAIGAALVAGANITITPNDGADTITIAASGSGGGGFLGQSYLGTNAAGSTTESPTGSRVYMKKITMATAGLLASIDVHLKDSGGGQVASFGGALFADSSGNPGKLMAPLGGWQFSNSYVMNTTFGWVSLPTSVWLPAGDYWVAMFFVDSGSILLSVTTTGGGDRYYDSGGTWLADSSFYTVNTTTKDYSIRASIVR